MRKLLFILLTLGIISSAVFLGMSLFDDKALITPFSIPKYVSFPMSGYYRDGKGAVYWGAQYLTKVYSKIEVDIMSFVVLNTVYAKDKTTVFYEDKAITADSSSFVLIPKKYKYILDENGLYLDVTQVANNQDFSESGSWGMDKSNIYFNGKEVVKNSYRSISYLATNIIFADNDILIGDASFTEKDIKVVMPNPGIDIASFRPYANWLWADRYSVYCFNTKDNTFTKLVELNRNKLYPYGKDTHGRQVFGDGNLYYTYFGGCIRVLR